MFDISVKQIRNSIQEMGEQEKEISALLGRLNTVCSKFDSLVEGNTDKQLLQKIIESVTAQRNSLADMKNSLAEIVKCYEETEDRIVSTNILGGSRNQFGLKDLRDVKEMLDNLNIHFE